MAKQKQIKINEENNSVIIVSHKMASTTHALILAVLFINESGSKSLRFLFLNV